MGYYAGILRESAVFCFNEITVGLSVQQTISSVSVRNVSVIPSTKKFYNSYFDNSKDMYYRFHRPKTRHWNQKLLRHCGKWKPALRDYFPCELKFEYRTRLTSNDDVLLFSMLSCDVAFTNSLSSSLICTKEMKIQQHFRKK